MGAEQEAGLRAELEYLREKQRVAHEYGKSRDVENIHYQIQNIVEALKPFIKLGSPISGPTPPTMTLHYNGTEYVPKAAFAKGLKATRDYWHKRCEELSSNLAAAHVRYDDAVGARLDFHNQLDESQRQLAEARNQLESMRKMETQLHVARLERTAAETELGHARESRDDLQRENTELRRQLTAIKAKHELTVTVKADASLVRNGELSRLLADWCHAHITYRSDTKMAVTHGAATWSDALAAAVEGLRSR